MEHPRCDGQMQQVLKIWVGLLIPACLAWGCSDTSGEGLPGPPVSKYAVGSEYSFKTRSAEIEGRFLVLKVEVHRTVGTIVHVTINGVRIKNPKSPKGYTDNVQHLPMAEAALDKSSPTHLKSGVALSDFQQAYQQWKRPFDEGKAGIWTLPLVECLEALEQTLNGSP